MPSLGRGTGWAKEQAKRNQTDWEHGIGADEWTSGRRDDGAKKGGKKGSKGSKPDWYSDKDKGGAWWRNCRLGLPRGTLREITTLFGIAVTYGSRCTLGRCAIERNEIKWHGAVLGTLVKKSKCFLGDWRNRSQDKANVPCSCHGATDTSPPSCDGFFATKTFL